MVGLTLCDVCFDSLATTGIGWCDSCLDDYTDSKDWWDD